MMVVVEIQEKELMTMIIRDTTLREWIYLQPSIQINETLGILEALIHLEATSTTCNTIKEMMSR